MPELPEVEVLVRHLAPMLKHRRIQGIEVRRTKVIAPTSERRFRQTLRGARFVGLHRRGKYLVFRLRHPTRADMVKLIGHLGMTGRMYLQPAAEPPPKHAAVIVDLGGMNFIYEDTRYFGRLTLDATPLARLGPEPLGGEFTVGYFVGALARSRQPIKLKLLDQTLVAGLGNIYANEALYRAQISPGLAASQLSGRQVRRLWQAMRTVLTEAIRFGSTVPLNWAGGNRRDGRFYYGLAEDAPDYFAERLRVYDREGQSCPACGRSILRIVQGARSTFYCPNCQRG